MMTIRGKLCLSAAAIGIAVLAAAPFSRLCAQQPSSPPGVTVGADRSRRRRQRHGWTGSRRLGDRGDHRPAHQIRQDRRHRRPGPLRHARPAEGEVQRLGARLRPGRFAEGRARRPGSILNLTAVIAPNAAAAAQYYPPIYWYSMLQDPGEERVPRHGPKGNGIATKAQPGEWLADIKTQRLHGVPCARHAGHARRSRRSSATSNLRDAWTRRIQVRAGDDS